MAKFKVNNKLEYLRALHLVQNIASPILENAEHMDCPIADNQYPCFIILWVELDRNGKSKIRNEVVSIKDFEEKT